jgi:hypothetical protein
MAVVRIYIVRIYIVRIYIVRIYIQWIGRIYNTEKARSRDQRLNFTFSFLASSSYNLITRHTLLGIHHWQPTEDNGEMTEPPQKRFKVS